MANSTTNLDLVSVNQAQKEATVNAALDAASPAMLYGRRALTSGGLVWGYYGGMVMAGGAPTQVINGVLTLAASAANYIEANPATGAVSSNTTGFTSGRTPLYVVVTGASTVTSYQDVRVGVLSTNGGTVKSVNGKTPDTGGDVTLAAADVGADVSGAAAAAVSAHAAASDPHPQYLTQSEAGALYDAANAATSAVSAHLAAADPHPQYLTQAEGDARYASASAATGVSSVNGHAGAVTLSASDVGAVPSTALGAANGAAQLGSDQKLLPAQLPDLAVISYLGTVASQAAMLALVGQQGDWCIRSDDSKVYVITGSNPASAGSWTALSYPVGTSGTVTSVDLSVPGLLYTVSGGPVTGSGTLTFALKSQAKNTFLAGPASGADTTPTMRTLTQADLPAQPFDIHTFYPGVPTASVKLYRGKLARAVAFPANFAGAQFTASANATASTVFDIQKNGVSVGSCTIAAGSVTATFTSSGGAAVNFAAGDILSVIAPGTADATLADPAITFAGTR